MYFSHVSFLLAILSCCLYGHQICVFLVLFWVRVVEIRSRQFLTWRTDASTLQLSSSHFCPIFLWHKVSELLHSSDFAEIAGNLFNRTFLLGP
jgi:hypothetical protein